MRRILARCPSLKASVIVDFFVVPYPVNREEIGCMDSRCAM